MQRRPACTRNIPALASLADTEPAKDLAQDLLDVDSTCNLAKLQDGVAQLLASVDDVVSRDV
jgi:hypothetical protein